MLLSYSAGTRNGGVVGFTVRSSRVHAYTNHAPYWAAIEMGQETKATDGDQDHVTAGFRVWHPKAMTEFTLLRLASDHPHFEVLANQFRECWKKGTAPDVARIYEIQVTALAFAFLLGVRVLANWRLFIHEPTWFFAVVLRAKSFVNVFPCGR